MEGATTPRNWSGALCLFICFALASVHKSQAGEACEPAPAGEASAGEQGPTVSPTRALRDRHNTQILVPTLQHCCHGGVGDGTEGWPIKYLSVCCAECRLSRLGKCYVGIKVEAVPDRKAWL